MRNPRNPGNPGNHRSGTRRVLASCLAFAAALLVAPAAYAGRGGSTAAIQAAVQSGSPDTIVAELERAEFLACLSCIEPVRALADYPSERVRQAAGWWLTRRGVRDELIAAMTARLAGQDPVAARNAADVLRGVRDLAALPALTAFVQRPLDEASGVAAMRAIGDLGQPGSLVAVQGALGSPLAGLRAESLKALRSLRSPVGAKVITDATRVAPLLTDADETVRREAALTIGFLGQGGLSAGWAPGVEAQLAGVVTSDSSARVRKAAAWALGEMGAASGAARAALTAAQNDTDPLVRSVAAAAQNRLR
jgi:HEAT repeat protein